MSIMQSTYADDVEPGLPGMVANSETSTIVSRTVDGPVEFGAPVMQGADDHSVAAVDADNSAVVGITKRDTTLGSERERYDSPAGEQRADTAAVVRQGVVWVRVGAAVARKAAPFYNRATNRYFGAAAAGRTPVPNSSFDDAATAADQMVRIRINLPGNV